MFIAAEASPSRFCVECIRKVRKLSSQWADVCYLFTGWEQWHCHPIHVRTEDSPFTGPVILISFFFYLLTYLLTYSMVQSPSWAANWFAASQEIPRISQNPKVHYRTHKRPPPVSILGQYHPVHIPTSYLLEIHPNIIHLSTPRCLQWSLSLRFPHQDPIHSPLLIHTRHMPSPSNSSRFYYIGWGVQII